MNAARHRLTSQDAGRQPSRRFSVAVSSLRPSAFASTQDELRAFFPTPLTFHDDMDDDFVSGGRRASGGNRPGSMPTSMGRRRSKTTDQMLAHFRHGREPVGGWENAGGRPDFVALADLAEQRRDDGAAGGVELQTMADDGAGEAEAEARDGPPSPAASPPAARRGRSSTVQSPLSQGAAPVPLGVQHLRRDSNASRRPSTRPRHGAMQSDGQEMMRRAHWLTHDAPARELDRKSALHAVVNCPWPRGHEDLRRMLRESVIADDESDRDVIVEPLLDRLLRYSGLRGYPKNLRNPIFLLTIVGCIVRITRDFLEFFLDVHGRRETYWIVQNMFLSTATIVCTFTIAALTREVTEEKKGMAYTLDLLTNVNPPQFVTEPRRRSIVRTVRRVTLFMALSFVITSFWVVIQAFLVAGPFLTSTRCYGCLDLEMPFVAGKVLWLSLDVLASFGMIPIFLAIPLLVLMVKIVVWHGDHLAFEFRDAVMSQTAVVSSAYRYHELTALHAVFSGHVKQVSRVWSPFLVIAALNIFSMVGLAVYNAFANEKPLEQQDFNFFQVFIICIVLLSGCGLFAMLALVSDLNDTLISLGHQVLILTPEEMAARVAWLNFLSHGNVAFRVIGIKVSTVLLARIFVIGASSIFVFASGLN